MDIERVKHLVGIWLFYERATIDTKELGDIYDLLISQQQEITKNNTIISNYLKTIAEDNEKFKELYGVIEGLKALETPKHETASDKIDKAYRSLDYIRQVLESEREKYDMRDDTMSKWAIDNVLGQVLPNLDDATKYMNVRRI